MLDLRFRALARGLVGTPAQVPWRKRPCAKWSYRTSTTSLGVSGSHSPVRSVDHREGPPGALPVKPGGSIKLSSIGVRSFLCVLFKLEQNPT